ncbi:hypothetical protein L3Q82_005871 [Scortum barcoo]|uniref:Uncharacterized protein n=1 Tax=Scortum barcoo TaxID=214431 RepID=A0ACB8V6Q1_9TELE|nr:hypothetical protein L3Q82_005871 [Scortum barcoo]
MKTLTRGRKEQALIWKLYCPRKKQRRKKAGPVQMARDEALSDAEPLKLILFTPTLSSHLPGHCHFTLCPVHLPPINTSLLQPAPHNTPGEECPEEEQGQESSRSGWHQLQAPEVLRRPAVWDFWVHIQPEPEAGESATTLEDVLHRPSAKDTAPQGAQQLQAGSSDVSSDEDAGETGPLAHLCPLVSSFMDPLQFAYQPDIGVDDAVIYLLHTSLTHLEKAGSTVRIMFFDFSSAFNTIQPRLLGDKLQLAGVDHHLTTWILALPHTQTTVYGDDREYRGLIQDFADWCLRNNLQINAGKTKELVVDFRRRRHFLLRRLRSFGVQGPLLRTFYDSVVASAIFYGIVCWASSITDRDRRRMDRLDTLTALGSSFSERLLHPRCVKESDVLIIAMPKYFMPCLNIITPVTSINIFIINSVKGPAGQTLQLLRTPDWRLAQRCPPDRGQEEAEVCARKQKRGKQGRPASQAKG